MDDVRFSTSLPRREYDAMVRQAREDDRSVASVARRILLREFFVPLGERDKATASRGVGTADGAAESRSPSVALGEGAAVGRTPPVASSPSVVPLRTAPAKTNGVCSKTGFSFADCLCAEHKGMS